MSWTTSAPSQTPIVGAAHPYYQKPCEAAGTCPIPSSRMVGAIADWGSGSTGTVLFDAGGGALLGYLVAPTAKRVAFAVAGGVLGGVFGFVGIVGLGIYVLAKGPGK